MTMFVHWLECHRPTMYCPAYERPVCCVWNISCEEMFEQTLSFFHTNHFIFPVFTISGMRDRTIVNLYWRNPTSDSYFLDTYLLQL